MKLIDRLIALFVRKLGPTIVVPGEVLLVVAKAYDDSFSVSSDYARARAHAVAAAASLGYITTMQGDTYGRHWRPTVEGMKALETDTDVVVL